MQGMAIVAQRIQLVLYRTQMQEVIRKRAAERFDRASMSLKQLELRHTEAVNSLKKAQEEPRNPRLEMQIRYLKDQLETLARVEPEIRTEELAAGFELKTEQAKLSDLQHQLGQLEQQLEARSPVLSRK